MVWTSWTPPRSGTTANRPPPGAGCREYGIRGAEEPHRPLRVRSDQQAAEPAKAGGDDEQKAVLARQSQTLHEQRSSTLSITAARQHVAEVRQRQRGVPHADRPADADERLFTDGLRQVIVALMVSQRGQRAQDRSPDR